MKTDGGRLAARLHLERRAILAYDMRLTQDQDTEADTQRMRIAVDAMGTDSRPHVDIDGGILAARDFGDAIVLVGDRDRLEAELAKRDTSGCQIEILHAPRDIAMDETPTDVLKSPADSSIHVALDAAKKGEVDAVVTMGNTGAVHAIATLKTLAAHPGREAAGACRRSSQSMTISMIFLDVGANTDVKAEWVPQFALDGQHLCPARFEAA